MPSPSKWEPVHIVEEEDDDVAFCGEDVSEMRVISLAEYKPEDDCALCLYALERV